MKHLFKVLREDDGVTISLAIKFTSKEVIDIAHTSNDPHCSSIQDLEKGYKKHGLFWLLHLLRLYHSYGNFPCTMDLSSKKERRRKLKKKKITSIEELGISHYIMASYLYYILNKPSPLSDQLFDKLSQKLLKNWRSLEHIHKHLITREDLKGGTLFGLNKKDYPLQAKHAAASWAREYGIKV